MRHVLSILVAGLVGFGGVTRANPVDPDAFLQLCGGTRVIVAPFGAASRDEMDQAARVVQQRISTWAPRAYVKYAAALELGFPIGMFDRVALDESLVRGQFSFQQVLNRGAITDLTIADSVQVILPDVLDDEIGYLLEAEAIIDATMIRDAQANTDMNGRPSVSLLFTADGAAAFGQYTTDHVGEAFAIVSDRRVFSAPVIQTAILGESVMIPGNFTAIEAENLAVTLRSGALPVDLVVEKVEDVVVDGQAGNPSCTPRTAE